MCGIFGHISNRKLEISHNLMPRRGPDGWGCEHRSDSGYELTFFHSRLQIIGLGEQGKQPMTLPDGSLLVFNGEIYNYRELREELEREKGCEFTTRTDTEVLLMALRHWPLKDVLDKVNGIFAFGFYDAPAHRLIVARDHLGVKPVYFHADGNSFSFSSEIKAMFACGVAEPRLNETCLGEYFANGWICEPDTLFEGIFKLEAGHFLTVELKKELEVMREAYWHIYDPPRSNTMPDLQRIVQGQLVADVPVGNYFSGGVDSSLITYLLKDSGLLHIHLTLGDVESQRVKQMEQAYGLNVHRMAPDAEKSRLYETLVYEMDEPIADPAIISAYWLAAEAHDSGCRVMLAGMGGDEIDAGYPRSRLLARLGMLRPLRLLPVWGVRLLLKGKKRRDVLRLLEFLKWPHPENYFNLFGYFTRQEIDRLAGREWYSRYAEKVRRLTAPVEKNKKFFLYEVRGFLASHNNIYGDKASMAASVECRVPLLDKDFAQYLFQKIDLPENAGKRRLNRVLKSYLGEHFFKVPKAGFRFPVGDYLQNNVDWRKVEANLRKIGVKDLSLFHCHLAGLTARIDEVFMKLWAYYTLSLWAEAFGIGSEPQ